MSSRSTATSPRSLATDPRAPGSLRVHVEDVLETDFERLRADGPPLRIVGNLPYNISTPVLFHLLAQRAAIADMHFMLQKEVVERMAAPPGGKEYGRLTVMLAAYAEVEQLVRRGSRRISAAAQGVVRDRAPAAQRRAALRHRRRRRAQVAGDGRLLSSPQDPAQRLEGPVERRWTSRSCGIDPQRAPRDARPAQFGRLAARYCQLGSGLARRRGSAQSVDPPCTPLYLRRMADYQKVLVLLDLSDDSEQVFVAGRDSRRTPNASIVALARGGLRAGRTHGRVVDAVDADRAGTRRARRESAWTSSSRGSARPTSRGRVEIGNTKAEILRVAEEEQRGS